MNCELRKGGLDSVLKKKTVEHMPRRFFFDGMNYLISITFHIETIQYRLTQLCRYIYVHHKSFGETCKGSLNDFGNHELTLLLSWAPDWPWPV